MSSSTYDAALKLLGFRARSVAELRGKLLRKGADVADVDEVIQRLCDQKLLDDADFARQFARSRLLGSGASRLRIKQELSRKGIARDISDRALTELLQLDGVDPAAAIARVAEKKWKSLVRVDDVTRRRRLYAFLARRGFDPDEIRTAMTALADGNREQ